jgi:hypothetical protein
MANALLDLIYGQLYPAGWQIIWEGIAGFLQKGAFISIALLCRIRDLRLGGIWSAKNLTIIDIEYFVEIGGNNCAV